MRGERTHFLHLVCLSGSTTDLHNPAAGLQGSAADLHGLAKGPSSFCTALQGSTVVPGLQSSTAGVLMAVLQTACSKGLLHGWAGLQTRLVGSVSGPAVVLLNSVSSQDVLLAVLLNSGFHRNVLPVVLLNSVFVLILALLGCSLFYLYRVLVLGHVFDICVLVGGGLVGKFMLGFVGCGMLMGLRSEFTEGLGLFRPGTAVFAWLVWTMWTPLLFVALSPNGDRGTGTTSRIQGAGCPSGVSIPGPGSIDCVWGMRQPPSPAVTHLDAGMGKRQRHRPSISLSEHMWTKAPSLTKLQLVDSKLQTSKQPAIQACVPPNHSSEDFKSYLHNRHPPISQAPLHLFPSLKTSFSSTLWCSSSPGSVT
ncbi:hypothetical protein ILYODFUR_000634 [Ilyodon furcidens]|uniref:Uncharacterized protein n=1 Tax=Ilyodon furcidens TaxID=33524 RepID=A0ABV0VCT5_9TELE